MPRRLRHIPQPGTLVEVTCRIIHGRKLMKPTRAINEMIIGILARAKRQFGVRICAAAYLSNHAHLLLVVDDAEQLAGFMNIVNSKIAREISKRTRWHDKIWSGRYSPVVVSDEPEAQTARLRYLLSQGVKEHLVARCVDWPGVHAAASLLSGRPLIGYWFDRSAEYRARLKGRKHKAYAFAERESLSFDPLPCSTHLGTIEYQSLVKEIVKEVERDAALDRRRKGLAPLGVQAILRQDCRQRPKRLARSPAPHFHAASQHVRHGLEAAYRWFEAAYRGAAERLRAGHPKPSFPGGCFPPAQPFIAST